MKKISNFLKQNLSIVLCFVSLVFFNYLRSEKGILVSSLITVVSMILATLFMCACAFVYFYYQKRYKRLKQKLRPIKYSVQFAVIDVVISALMNLLFLVFVSLAIYKII